MKQVIVLGAALVGTLTLAYTVWTDDGEARDPESIPLTGASADALTSISYTSDTDTLVVTRVGTGDDAYLWLSDTETVEVPVVTGADPTELEGPEGDDPAGEDPAGEDTPPEVRTETRTVAFLGNAQADALWSNFAPLLAARELETVADRAAFGLEEPSGTIDVVSGGQTVHLALGGQTFGSRDRYVGLGERVFLISDRTLRPLEYGKTRLVERRLLPEDETFSGVTLTVGDRSASWTRQNPDDRLLAYWAKAGTPDVHDEAAKTWMEKIFSVRVQTYVDEDDLDATLAPVLSYTLAAGDKSWTVDVSRAVTDGDDGAFYARSSYNHALVEITPSLAADAFLDVEGLLGE